MKEAWGFYGLANALFFLLIASRLNHRNVSFAFAGLGLLLYDQTRSLHGFWYVSTQHGIHIGTLAYMLLSLTIGILFLIFFCKAIQAIYRYQIFKRDQLDLYAAETYPLARKWALLDLVLPTLLYLGLGSLTRTAAKLEPVTAFGILRLIGGTIFFAGFLMIGQTLDRFFRNRKTRTEAILLIIFHVIALTHIQGTIFRLTPLAALIHS